MEVVQKLNKQMPVSAMLDPKIVFPAIGSAFVKLDPRVMIKSPVMFVVEVVAALTTVIFLRDLVTGGANLGFTFQIILWLWFTVLFANFAEAIAEAFTKTLIGSQTTTSQEHLWCAGESVGLQLLRRAIYLQPCVGLLQLLPVHRQFLDQHQRLCRPVR